LKKKKKMKETFVPGNEVLKEELSIRLDRLSKRTWFKFVCFSCLVIGVICMLTLIFYLNVGLEGRENRYHNENTITRSCLNGGLFFLFVYGILINVLARNTQEALQGRHGDLLWSRVLSAAVMDLLVTYFMNFSRLFPGPNEELDDTNLPIYLFLACLAWWFYPLFLLVTFLQTPSWLRNKRQKE